MTSLNSPPTGEVKDTIKDLFTTKKYSDLGIYCRGKFWDVHQAIVCMRSIVLEQFCTKSGRQSQGKLHIDLSEYESEVLEAVLSFMYLDHYTAGGEEGVMFHTKVFIAACKFEMRELKSLAVSKYQDTVRDMGEEWETQFCAAAGILWGELSIASEGSVLKAVVIEVARQRVKELIGSERGEFKALGLQRPEIGMAVLEAVVGSTSTTLTVEEPTEVTEVPDLVDEIPVTTSAHFDDITLSSSETSIELETVEELDWDFSQNSKLSKKTKKEKDSWSPEQFDIAGESTQCFPETDVEAIAPEVIEVDSWGLSVTEKSKSSKGKAEKIKSSKGKAGKSKKSKEKAIAIEESAVEPEAISGWGNTC